MRRYSLAEASRLLRMPRRVIDSLLAAGFVHALRGSRGRFELAFQDLVVLRAAQNLVSARVPAARIARTLARLRRQLPDVPPARLRVEAMGRSIVVREADSRFVADTGQYLLAFDVVADAGEVRAIAGPESVSADEWLVRAGALEEHDPARAAAAYREAMRLSPSHPAAYANLGCLLHAQGHNDEAHAVYEEALSHGALDATLLFNFAVLLEDRGDLAAAERRYREAITLDPEFADAHCNLGLLYERMGEARGALRHLRTYRQLARK